LRRGDIFSEDSDIAEPADRCREPAALRAEKLQTKKDRYRSAAG